MPETFRVLITPAGHGYLAENAELAISAGGSTPIAAAEKIRLMARDLLRALRLELPAWITACIQDDHSTLFVTGRFNVSLGDDDEIRRAS